MKKILLLLLALALFLPGAAGCAGGPEVPEVLSQLEPGTILPTVRLSRGVLRFKTAEEATAQFLSGIEGAKVRLEDLREAKECVFSRWYQWNEALPVLLLLGIRPEMWLIPARLTESREERDTIRIYTDPERSLYIQDGSLYACVFSDDLSGGAAADQVIIRVRAAGQEVSRMPEGGILPEGGGTDTGGSWRASLLSLDCLLGSAYGNRDSRAGSTALSIVCGEHLGETTFGAYFTWGNGDWNIYTHGLTQEEFLDLLLSILAQPEPIKADVTAWLLEQDG